MNTCVGVQGRVSVLSDYLAWLHKSNAIFSSNILLCPTGPTELAMLTKASCLPLLLQEHRMTRATTPASAFQVCCIGTLLIPVPSWQAFMAQEYNGKMMDREQCLAGVGGWQAAKVEASLSGLLPRQPILLPPAHMPALGNEASMTCLVSSRTFRQLLDHHWPC